MRPSAGSTWRTRTCRCAPTSPRCKMHGSKSYLLVALRRQSRILKLERRSFRLNVPLTTTHTPCSSSLDPFGCSIIAQLDCSLNYRHCRHFPVIIKLIPTDSPTMSFKHRSRSSRKQNSACTATTDVHARSAQLTPSTTVGGERTTATAFSPTAGCCPNAVPLLPSVALFPA
jgi:hypothetical protein